MGVVRIGLGFMVEVMAMTRVRVRVEPGLGLEFKSNWGNLGLG